MNTLPSSANHQNRLPQIARKIVFPLDKEYSHLSNPVCELYREGPMYPALIGGA